MRNWKIIILLTFFYKSLFAGEIPLRFSHLSDKNGLPHNYTFNVVQDKKGFIWIGTNNGLARFNGYEFKIYKPIPNQANSIAKKPANFIYSDKKGNLWINFRGMGLNKLNLETEVFTYYSPENKEKHHIAGTQIRKFIEDKDSVLWIVTDKGIEKYDPLNDSFISILPNTITKTSIPNYNIYNLVFDISGNIWFRSTRGIGFFNVTSGKVTSLGTLLSKPEIDLYGYTSINFDGKNSLWITTQNHGLLNYQVAQNTLTYYLTETPNIINSYIDKKGNLYLYADTPNYSLIVFEKTSLHQGNYTKHFLHRPASSVSVVRFAEDNSGNLWFGSYQGLEMYSPEKKQIIHFRGDAFLPNSLISDEIESLSIDNSDNIWVSLHRKGICKADLKQKPFRWYLSHPINKSNSLAGDIVTAIHKDQKGYLWIGCSGDGLTKYNEATNEYFNVPISSNSKVNKYSFTSIFEDKAGYIWLGYSDDIVDKYDPRTNKLYRYSTSLPNNSPYHFRGRGVRKITSDKEGNLWMASMIGIIEYNQATQSFIYHTVLYDKNTELSAFCRVVHADQEGIIWAGSNIGGLICYDKKNHSTKHFTMNSTAANSISSNTVYSIYDDNKGTLWIGTAAGLNKFDKKNQTFSNIGIKQGLNQYSILSIIPDNNGYFWMSTENGLIRMNTKNYDCSFYLESDGLLSNEFNTTASFQDTNGTIYLGSPKGMISFNPSEISTNPYLPKPVVSNLMLFNHEVNPGDCINKRILLTKNIAYTKEIILRYNENDFTLSFSALHYASPDKINYWYKLEGFKSNWIQAGANRRYASFAGLQPGDYVFKLKAANNDGIMCRPEDEATLHITILPPFWMTIWFRSLIILFIISLVVLYIKYRTLALRKLNLQLEQKVEERTADLKEVNVMLEERQEEINLQKEELMVQRDNLEDVNKILMQQQNKIIEQNKELDKHRNELSQIVEERTRELVKALYKAEESDRLKSAFLANMSHEIRTPMNAILGFSSLLMNKNITEEEKDQYISIINKNGKSLMVLINDIIDISLIQSNQIEITLSGINVKLLFQELKDIFTLEAGKKNIFIVFNENTIPENLKIETDLSRLKQVFSNLITNALKFTQKGGIEFGISNITHEVLFYVKDTGIGIPPEAGNSIFDRFIKLEKYKDKLYGGTGLGLAISKSLVELLGGKIWYESEINKGTTFFFTLPFKKMEDGITTPELQVTDELLEIPNLTGKRILIAEDEDYNYKLLHCYLMPTKAEINWALNGKEAIELALNNHYDLILMDIKMPVLNGIEAITKIKRRKPELPIIAQTAFAYKAEIEELITAGINNYLVKPIKQTELLKIVKKVLEIA